MYYVFFWAIPNLEYAEYLLTIFRSDLTVERTPYIYTSILMLFPIKSIYVEICGIYEHNEVVLHIYINYAGQEVARLVHFVCAI